MLSKYSASFAGCVYMMIILISIVTDIDFLKLTLFAHASEIYYYIFFMELSMLLIVEVCY